MSFTAQPTDLATLADVKTYLGITTTQNDQELQQLLSGVTQAMYLEAHLPTREDGEPITLFEDTYKERYSGKGGPIQSLRWTPVTKVMALSINEVDVPLSTKSTDPGFTWDRFAVYVRGHRFTPGIRNIAITYTAGQDASGPLAATLTLETVELVAAMFKGKKYLHIQSEKLGDQMVTYARQSMPQRVLDLLSRIGPKVAIL